MLTIVELTYKVPIAQVEAATDSHRAFLRTLQEKNLLLVAGPLSPRTGGIMVFAVETIEEAEELLEGDPFKQAGIADYAYRLWNPVIGAERLA